MVGFPNAKLIPAEKKGDYYCATRNVNSQFFIGTAENLREIAANYAYTDILKNRNLWLEVENERLENKPDYSMYWFIGGLVLGAYVAK